MKATLFPLLLLAACNAEKRINILPSQISCPTQLSESSELKPGSIKYGMLNKSEKILLRVGLVTGGPSDTIDPSFDEEHIDEWENTPEGARAIWEYPRGRHDGMNLRCDYWPKGKYDGRGGGYQKVDGRVTLLLPLPDSANFKCTFIRNAEKLKFSATCDLEYSAPMEAR